jgi:uncharacterized protein
LRFLIRVQAAEVPGEKLLESVKSIAKTLGADPRNPKWTSFGALELDVFCPTRADLDLFIEAVKPIAEFEFVKDLNVAPPHREEVELFAEARDLFNDERYWECHEVLEGVWRTKQGEEKRLLQGIILVCAAFVHHQKGEETVALGVLGRAVKQLVYSGPVYAGFRVDELKQKADEILQTRDFRNFRV